jgi:hypothetical protein
MPRYGNPLTGSADPRRHSDVPLYIKEIPREEQKYNFLKIII